jgi:hypothetical protein
MSYMHHAWTGEHQPGGVSLPGALVTSVRFGAQEYLATPTLRSARNSCNSDGSDRWTASGDQRCHAVCETASWLEETVEKPNARRALTRHRRTGARTRFAESSFRRRVGSANPKILS